MATNPGKNNLISWWSLNETSGTRTDSHGTNHLSDNNTVGYAAGKVGNSASFVKANAEHLSHVDNADLSFDDEDFTVCLWTRLSSKPGDVMYMVCKGAPGAVTTQEYRVLWHDLLDRFWFGVSDGTDSSVAQATSLGAPSIGTWYFIVAYHDSVNDLLGISVNAGATNTATHAGGVQDGTSGFNIGGATTIGLYWNGLIDEIALWSKLLSQEEIDWLYNSGNGRTYAELALQADVLPLTVTALGAGVGLYDARIKLRARARDTHLTTKVRNQG